MAEVLKRRLQRLDEDDDAPVTRRRFAYRPNLLLIDGGKGQLSSVLAVLDALGLRDEIEVASLAKQFEEVYRPGESRPRLVPRGSEGLFLLQRLRDEAHRFAITFHRQRRGARMTASILDGVVGLGPTRQRRLLEHFGTMGDLRSASLEDLSALSWLPTSVAEGTFAALHADDAPTTARDGGD
jgi:excinuclease ABC subunit C